MNKIFIFALIAISLVASTMSVICRDGSSCPGIGSCCLVPIPGIIPRQGVACCPFPNASCGPFHCCPQGYAPFGNGGCRPLVAGYAPFVPRAGLGIYGRILPFL